MAMSQAQALGSDQATQSQTLGQRKPWFELWGTYAVAFLVAVSVAILLPNRLLTKWTASQFSGFTRREVP